MSTLRTLGWIAYFATLVVRRISGTAVRVGRFVGRYVGIARERGGAGEAGMIRLLDLHAASCAGDTLIAIGLAGTVFFSVPVGEARGRVALYLLVTMLPFAVLAPVVGPVLDRFRHGRRYALAVTMLGRACLAYLIANNLGGLELYPAAFAILVLSRAYGVARGAAVPRLLPEGLGLSVAGARASVFGTAAAAVAAPVGLAAYSFGPQWTLRLAVIVFALGAVFSLRLPPRTDDQPPETVPRLFQRPGNRGSKVLSGQLVVSSLIGSATVRALYGFLALYLAFSVRAGHLPTRLAHWTLTPTATVGLVAGALGLGSFLATAVGSGLRINRPVVLQAAAISAVTLAVAVAAWHLSLLTVAVLCGVTALSSGLAKLAVDAVIQERVAEPVRASAFAHSETLLMIAWVAGGALGLVPFDGRTALILAAGYLVFGTARAVVTAVRLRDDRMLSERPRAASDQAKPAEPTTAPIRQPAAMKADPQDASSRDRPRRRSAKPQPQTEVLLKPDSNAGADSGDDPPLAPPGYHLYRPGDTN